MFRFCSRGRSLLFAVLGPDVIITLLLQRHGTIFLFFLYSYSFYRRTVDEPMDVLPLKKKYEEDYSWSCNVCDSLFCPFNRQRVKNGWDVLLWRARVPPSVVERQLNQPNHPAEVKWSPLWGAEEMDIELWKIQNGFEKYSNKDLLNRALVEAIVFGYFPWTKKRGPAGNRATCNYGPPEDRPWTSTKKAKHT